MTVAEIIAIGTELLLGEIQDTNTHYLACCLRDNGIDLYRAVIIGDNPERIAQAVRDALAHADIVITTGGLGPTVDDPTRQAVAMAVGVETAFVAELWEQIQTRFQKYGRLPTENNRRQAYLPVGASAIPNEVGTAPAFYYRQGEKTIVSLPGVPRELEYLIETEVIPLLKRNYRLEGLIKASVVHVAGEGESQVDEWIGDLETLSNPTVGLRAHPGQVDIRVTAKAASEGEADALIRPVLEKLKDRLGNAIFGFDGETLEAALGKVLSAANLKMACVEYGLGGAINERLVKAGVHPDMVSLQETPLDYASLKMTLKEFVSSGKAGAAFGACFSGDEENQVLQMILYTPFEYTEKVRSYGGPRKNVTIWAVNTALDFLRRNLQRARANEIA